MDRTRSPALTLALVLFHSLTSGHSAMLMDVPIPNLYPGLLKNETNSTEPTANTVFFTEPRTATPPLLSEIDTTQLTEVSQADYVTWGNSVTIPPEEMETIQSVGSTMVPFPESTDGTPYIGITDLYVTTVAPSEATQTTVIVGQSLEIVQQLNEPEITQINDIPTNLSSKTNPSESNIEIANTYYEVENKQSKDIITSVVKEAKDSHPCVRECIEGAMPMKCYYRFELEWYYTMSKACYDCPSNTSDCDRMHCIPADGVKRPVIVVNRQMPGPSVEVCLGDSITVDLVNHMMEETTTIHWHGHHQRGTPYMDGVPYVTQCPVPPKSTFRYRYSADTPGTHFWHSHSGCQRADGAYGALIIHVPHSRDPHSKLYDFDLTDHTIQIIDWGHELGIDKFLAHHHSNGTNKPKTLLVNGRGWVGGFRDMPTAAFQVEQGYRYRFRLINSGFLNCPIEMSVDNHTLLVISSDGSDIRPVPATSLVSYAGERFDFILEANQNVANYWLRFRGLMDCDQRFTSAHQVAVLHYQGAPVNEEPHGSVNYNTSHRPGQQVNSLNVGPGTNLSLVIPELDALVEDDISLKPEPDMQLYLSYDFYGLDNPHYHRSPHYGFKNVTDRNQRLFTPQLNHISMKLQPFPLLSGRDSLRPEMLCNQSTVGDCEDTYCECTHVVQVPLGSVVELILVDIGVTYDANHPFHLHGHAFRVVAMGRVSNTTTVEEVKSLDEQGLIKRKLKGAPIKDTVTVPDGGYTVLRVHASNPGYWLFHCHIEFHVELGMSVVFKVGEHSDIAPIPRGFPQCNNWLPDEDLDMEAEVVMDIENEVPIERLQQQPSSGHRTLISSLVPAVLLVVSFLQWVGVR